MHFFITLHHVSVALLVQRLCVGLIFWAHGRMKAPMRKMQPFEQLPASALRNLSFSLLPAFQLYCLVREEYHSTICCYGFDERLNES